MCLLHSLFPLLPARWMLTSCIEDNCALPCPRLALTRNSYMGLLGELEIKRMLLRFGGFLVTVATVTLNNASHVIYALPGSCWLLYGE